jgi:hypothetical protein
MDMTTMSTGAMIACILFGLLVLTFLIVGIAAAIKYLSSPREPRAISDAQRSVAHRTG